MVLNILKRCWRWCSSRLIATSPSEHARFILTQTSSCLSGSLIFVSFNFMMRLWSVQDWGRRCLDDQAVFSHISCCQSSVGQPTKPNRLGWKQIWVKCGSFKTPKGAKIACNKKSDCSWKKCFNSPRTHKFAVIFQWYTLSQLDGRQSPATWGVSRQMSVMQLIAWVSWRWPDRRWRGSLRPTFS